MIEKPAGGPPDQSAADTPDVRKGAEPIRPKRRRRWLFIGLGIVIVLALVVLVAPKYVVRYVAERELAKLGIETHGIGTIDINVPQGRVSMGPVEFSAGGADRGLIGNIVFDIDLLSLFEQKALAERVIIEGVELVLARSPDGQITINGIDPAQFITGEEQPEEIEEDAERAWDAGIQNFQFRDSKLIIDGFIEGEPAVIALEYFDVHLFHTWVPEEPGTIEFKGNLDGAILKVYARARPFSDDLIFGLQFQLEKVELAKVRRYLRFSEDFRTQIFDVIEGTIQTRSNYFGVIMADQTIALNGVQRIALDGLRLVTPDDRSMALDSANVTLKSIEYYRPTGEFEFAGDLTTAFESFAAAPGDGAAVEVANLQVHLQNYLIEGDGKGAYEAVGDPELTIEGLQARADDSTSVTVATGNLNMVGVDVSPADDGGLDVAAELSLALKDITTVVGGAEGAIASVSGDVTETTLRLAADGAVALTSSPNLRIDGVRLGGPLPLSAGQIAANLSPVSIDVAGANVVIAATGAASLSDARLALTGPDGAPGPDVDIASATATLTGLNTQLAGDAINVKGGLETRVDGLEAEVPQDGGAVAVVAEQIAVSLPNLAADVAGATTRLDVGGGANLAGMTADVPAGSGLPAMTVGLDALDLTLNETSATLSDADPQYQTSLDLSLSGATAEIAIEPAATFNVGSLNVSGLRTDQTGTIILDEVLVGALEADISDRLPAAFGGGDGSVSEAEPGSGAASAPSAGGSPIKILHAQVGGGSVISFTDTSVDPPAIIPITVNELEIHNVDTSKPNDRTQLAIHAGMFESSRINVTGWATPLKPTPDFDVKVNIDQLPLPTFSPYARDAIGMDLNGGDLDTDFTARAEGNALRGKLRVMVSNLFLKPATDEYGREMEDKIGLPVEFAVGLLKDSRGRIDLTFPIAGTLDEPDIGYGDVIRTALTGLIGSLFGSGDYQGADGFKLAPAFFQPGAAELDQRTMIVVDRYVDLLRRKSTLNVGVCGQATRPDYAAVFSGRAGSSRQGSGVRSGSGDRESKPAATGSGSTYAPAHLTITEKKELTELATARTNAVRRYMMDRGIRPERLPQCRVSYNMRDSEQPKVIFAW